MVEGAFESVLYHKQTATKVELYAFSSTANAEPPPGGSLNEEPGKRVQICHLNTTRITYRLQKNCEKMQPRKKIIYGMIFYPSTKLGSNDKKP